MTPTAAIHSFLSGFGLNAYESNSVPTDVQMPYLTYDPVIDYWQNETVLQVNLWYRGTENTIPNAKAKEIGDALNGGRILPCEAVQYGSSVAHRLCRAWQTRRRKHQAQIH